MDHKLLKTENDYLTKCLGNLNKQLGVIDLKVDVKEDQILNLKRYFWEHINSLDKYEILRLEEDIAVRTSLAMDNFKKAKSYKQMLDSPYFGSFMFDSDSFDLDERIYIGISSLIDEFDIYIYDWRTPIGGLFYEHPGRVSYHAPKSIISGRMHGKRQYKIEKGQIIYALENELNITDDILQEVLSGNTTDTMKNIVNTIQTDQNAIIRNVSSEVLVIQGIAGSGKTSVALHRIAYLLYKQKDYLSSSNIIIFSPNDVFTTYISDVLPSLGEDNVIQTTFSSYAKTYIKEYQGVTSYFEYLEKLYEDTSDIENLVSELKMGSIFKEVIDAYYQEICMNTYFTNDLYVDKYKSVDRSEINSMLIDRFKKQPLFSRIDLVADKCHDKFNLNNKSKKRSLYSRLNKLLTTKQDYKKIYKELFLSEAFTNLLKKKYTNEEIEKIANYSIKNLKSQKIGYLDSVGFLYLKGLLEGFDYTPLIKQVVIDEAQDYNVTQFAIFKNLFRTAKFTILGDFNQLLNYVYKEDTLTQVHNLFKEDRKSDFVQFDKTYRSSFEITEYVNQILDLNNVNIVRAANGKDVKELKGDYQTLVNEVIKHSKEYLSYDYNSVCIITKNLDDARRLYDAVKDDIKELALIDNINSHHLEGAFIIPSYLAKGLEFDSVIVATTKENQYQDYEKKLYYVVCTRALHDLVIIDEI